MRLRTFLSACFLMFCAFEAAHAQTHNQHLTRTTLGEHEIEPRSVIRPASTTMWRNYVTVPDGPCGYPMAVQADCYNPTTRPCGPLHPICFSKRVVRMLDCLIPCNLCCGGGCHGGGCGGTWGHCSMCCGGGSACGGWGGSGPACGCGSGNSGCCANPAGSVFDSVPCCTTGGHCHGCSATTPGCSDTAAPPVSNDPFQDDPLPMPPRPISTPSTEVRRVPTQRTKPVSTPARSNMAQGTTKSTQPRTLPARETSVLATNKSPATSPYKIVSKPAAASSVLVAPQTLKPRNSVTAAPPKLEAPAPVLAPSVLRRASAETVLAEPAPHTINHARTQPISAAPLATPIPDYYDTSVPSNPLR